MMRNRIIPLLLILLIPAVLLAGCNLPASGDPTATPGGINATQANQTVIARVTEVAMLTASPAIEAASATPDTTSQDGEPTETPVPSATSPPPTAAPTSTPTPVPCDKAAPGDPIDITIPDDTPISAGTGFTKTWRLVNSGTCTWNQNYAVVWQSGAQMGVEDVVFLNGTISPGQTVDISVPMTAPTEPGTYQTNWLLRNAAGVLFGIGDEGNLAFWARIEVISETATPTATTTATATSGPSPTPTPIIKAAGNLTLEPGDLVNLDNLVVNGSQGNDILYDMDASDNYILSPQAGVLIGVYGASQPGLPDCQAASLGSTLIGVESLQSNTYLCFKTNVGRYGWLQFQTLDTSEDQLTIGIRTWE
jgi:hypothetical protein